MADLHVWQIGPHIYAVIASLVSSEPYPPDHYKRLLPDDPCIVHVTIEVRPDAERHVERREG